MIQHDRSLETLAVAAHSGSLVLHALGVVYHCSTARRLDAWAVMHAAMAVFSGVSVVVHARRITHGLTHGGFTSLSGGRCPDDDTWPMFV